MIYRLGSLHKTSVFIELTLRVSKKIQSDTAALLSVVLSSADNKRVHSPVPVENTV